LNAIERGSAKHKCELVGRVEQSGTRQAGALMSGTASLYPTLFTGLIANREEMT
jgi:hypothetical protein